MSRSSLEVIAILQQGILGQTTFQPFHSTCDAPLGLLSCINGKKTLLIFTFIVECKDKKQSLAFNKEKGIKTLGWDYYELLIMLTIMSKCTNQEKSLGKIIKECSLEPSWCTSEPWAILNSHDSPWLRLGRSHCSLPFSIIYSIAHFKSYNNMIMFFKTPIPILKLLSHESHHLGVNNFLIAPSI